MKVREKEISLLGREIQFAYTEMKKLAYSLEAEVERKDKIIKKMQEASTYCDSLVKAALEAAERGGK